MPNLTEFQTVVLAALLHDIGKFLQRGRNLSFNIKGTHPEVSGRFVSAFADVFKPVADVYLLRDLVIHHHQDKAKEITDKHARHLAYLVNKADVLSSRERGEHPQERRDYKTTPLVPVFHRVFSGRDTDSVLCYHPFFLTEPGNITEASIFPDPFPAYASGELEGTITAFGDHTKSVFTGLDGDFNTLISHILALLQSYTPAIPADTQEAIPDTSLYDHMKTTAAIAACLYQACEARNDWGAVQREDKGLSFFLLVGDVSGIQKYVFEIAKKDSTGGGVAKRLRARSLFVQLVSEVAPLQILKKFGLPLTNILMASGGKFYLLLPALPDTEKRLERYRQFAEDWFLNTFKGALGLNLDWVSCSESGLGKGFGDTVKRAMTALAAKKERGFRQPLAAGTGWNPSAFVLSPFGEKQRACPSCDKFGAPENGLCFQCQSDITLGKALPTAKCISIALQSDGRGRELLGADVNVGDYETLDNHTSLALHINNPGLLNLIKYPASFRYLARHVPRRGNGEVMDFQEIAGNAYGRDYLGFLKADVDRLAEIFAFGLRGTKDRWDTPSRIATLSRQLDLFFTGWVEHLLETEFQDCYCVFSGGDDLFIIGPWNRILDFATKLREDFTRYTCHNKKITLSAGVVLESHNYPVGQAADEAGSAVEKSKSDGRNRLTVLGSTVTWEEWVAIKTLWEDLRQEKTSSAFLYSLLGYARMWQEYSRWVKTGGKEGNILGLRFQPLLAYNLKRNLNPQNNRRVYEWAEKLLEWRPNSGNKDVEKTLDNLGLIVQLLILWKGDT